MARQRSIFKIEGKLDEWVFYMVGKDARVRHKGTLNKKRFERDPEFEGSRRASSEFSGNAKAVGLFRAATRQLWEGASDSGFTSRLTSLFCRMVKRDPVNEKGQRNLTASLLQGDSKQLCVGFDFNKNASLHRVLLCKYHLDTGDGTVSLKEFNPKTHLKKPKGATHVNLQCGYAVIDFGKKNYETRLSEEFIIPVSAPAGNYELVPGVMPEVSGQRFFFLRICFLQEVNDELHELGNKSYNSCCIIG